MAENTDDDKAPTSRRRQRQGEGDENEGGGGGGGDARALTSPTDKPVDEDEP